MTSRPARATAVAASLAGVVAVLAAACTGGSDRPSPSPESPSAADDGVLQLTEARFEVGPPEIVMGPSTYVDSILNAVRVGSGRDRRVRAYVGRGDTLLLEGRDVTDLAPTDRIVLERGEGDTFDRCGAWLDAVVHDERDPGLLRAWYHAETDCIYHAHQTRKSIAYAESRDGGLTFTKPGYPDNQVVRSPHPTVAGERTGRGNFSVVRRDRFLYLYYLEELPGLRTVTSVARAPIRSGGVPGTWRSYTEDAQGRGSWSAPALDGPAAALDTLVPAASASIHAPSGEVVLARQNTPSGGIVLQSSADGIHFSPLPEPLAPYLPSDVRTDWGAADGRQVLGYVSIVAKDGAREWDDSFYLFHMYAFPGDDLDAGRYLVRREVIVTEAPEGGPWSTVAVSSYVDEGDRFEAAAPVKPDARRREVLGHVLATPAPDRMAVLECTSPRGDRFISGACGSSATRGRLVGYAFRGQQEDTAALYRCVSEHGDQFATLDATCEGGRRLAEIGYVYTPAPA